MVTFKSVTLSERVQQQALYQGTTLEAAEKLNSREIFRKGTALAVL